jgi:hypothetical protein
MGVKLESLTSGDENRSKKEKQHKGEENCIKSSVMICCPQETLLGLMARRETRYACRCWWEKLQGKRPRERPANRWKYIKMFHKVAWEGVDWINLAQDGDKLRDLVNTVMVSEFVKSRDCFYRMYWNLKHLTHYVSGKRSAFFFRFLSKTKRC